MCGAAPQRRSRADGYLLGVDVGTATTKGILSDTSGRVVATARRSHVMSIPRPGWAEMDPDMWWSDVCAVTREILLTSGVDTESVIGVGLSAIGPCMAPLDSADQPVRPALLYGIDARAHGQITVLEERIGTERIRQLSGMDLSSQAVGPKIRWLREVEPESWARTARIVTASSFLVHRMTGRHVIDHHQAGHVIPLYDPAKLAWTDTFAESVADPAMLPELGWSDDIAGLVGTRAAEDTGLALGTPVIVGGVDAVQEGLSVGVSEPGQLMVMYGSSAFFVLVTDERNPAPPLWCLPGALEGTWVLAAGMSTTGSATAWLRDWAMADRDFDQLFASAAEVEPGARGLLFLPYLSGERTPINDAAARGIIAGLSLDHGRPEIFRALLEGVGHGIRQNISLLAEAAEVHSIHAVGGGTASDTWLQIVSDIIGREQVVAAQSNGASLGNAFLAGVAVEAVQLADLPGWVGTTRRIVPDPTAADVYDRAHEDFDALYRQTRDVVHHLANG